MVVSKTLEFVNVSVSFRTAKAKEDTNLAVLPEWSWVKSMPAVKLMACSRISYATEISIELERCKRLKGHTVSPIIAYGMESTTKRCTELLV